MTITIYLKKSCTFIADCVSFAGGQVVITLDKNRGVVLYPIAEVLLIEPTPTPKNILKNN